MDARARSLPAPPPASTEPPAAPPPAPRLRSGWSFSRAAFGLTALGLAASGVLFIGLIGALCGGIHLRLTIRGTERAILDVPSNLAPEVAFRWALAAAVVGALATGFFAGVKARRLAFFELLTASLVVLAVGAPAVAIAAWRPFDVALLPADVVYLVGLLPSPIAGPAFVGVLLAISAIVALPAGYMVNAGGRASFASAYEFFIARRHLGIDAIMLVRVFVLVVSLFTYLIPIYLLRKILEGLSRNHIADVANGRPTRVERLAYALYTGQLGGGVRVGALVLPWRVFLVVAAPLLLAVAVVLLPAYAAYRLATRAPAAGATAEPAVAAERLLDGLERGRGTPTQTMTTISLSAVALGVAALCVVLSVMSGFELDLKKKILGTNAHAVVLKYGADFSEYRDVEKTVQSVPGVTGASAFVLNEVMISSEQNISGVLIKGVDPRTVGKVSDLPGNVQEGDLHFLEEPAKIPVSPLSPGGPSDTREALKELDAALDERAEFEAERTGRPAKRPAARETAEDPEPAAALPAVLLGRELARSLKVYVGDRVNVVSPLGGELGPHGPMPKSRPFRVGGICYSGMYEYDSKFAYIHLAEAQQFFGLKDTVTGLELKVADIDDARKIARAVVTALNGYPYRTKDWGEMNRNLFSALRLEKLVMGVILAIIVVVACLLILGTLIVLAFEKRKEIAILKSLGAAEASVMKIFIAEGTLVGIVGTAIGLAAGVGLCLFVEYYGIRLDPEVYYIHRLPVRLDALQYAVVAVISLVLCFLGTIYPALAASELSPVEGLRNE